MSKQLRIDVDEEIIVDLFAGGGGMSVAIEEALGRSPDIAINHDKDALSMHRVNHPQTRHFVADVFEVCPRGAAQGRPVGLLHFSSECTHHSQASGGQPRDRKSRALSWVGVSWAGQVSPRVITMENVKQILQWCPLIAKRDKVTGRVVTLDMVKCQKTGKMVHRIAEPGERVPLEKQFLVPNKKLLGQTWSRFVRILEGMGYVVQYFPLNAADHGAPTTRVRVFMIARRDGQPIVKPEPVYFKKPTRGQRKWRPAAECINWELPSKSIFGREKPLAEATMRRIAKGVKRYVLDSADPFIVPITHTGSDRVHDINDPLRTITTAHRGEFAVASANLVKFKGDSAGCPVDGPLPTITSGAGAKRPAGAAHALGIATAHLAQMNGGFNETPGHDAREPMSTVTNTGSQQQLVTAHLAHLRNNCDARDPADPLKTISAGGEHHGLVTAFLSRQFGESVGHAADCPHGTITAGGGGKSALVECHLSPAEEAGALRVAAFLVRYYSTGGQWGDIRDPMDTITSRDRLALVTVIIKGTPYVIVDICLRMLVPRELYLAQGFPPDYIIEYGHDGRKFSKSKQVKMVGNSVSPPPAIALIQANCADLSIINNRRARVYAR